MCWRAASAERTRRPASSSKRRPWLPPTPSVEDFDRPLGCCCCCCCCCSSRCSWRPVESKKNKTKNLDDEIISRGNQTCCCALTWWPGVALAASFAPAAAVVVMEPLLLMLLAAWPTNCAIDGPANTRSPTHTKKKTTNATSFNRNPVGGHNDTSGTRKYLLISLWVFEPGAAVGGCWRLLFVLFFPSLRANMQSRQALTSTHFRRRPNGTVRTRVTHWNRRAKRSHTHWRRV